MVTEGKFTEIFCIADYFCHFLTKFPLNCPDQPLHYNPRLQLLTDFRRPHASCK